MKSNLQTTEMKVTQLRRVELKIEEVLEGIEKKQLGMWQNLKCMEEDNLQTCL